MKIFGIGTDIVRISRIKKSLKKKLFVERLFNKKEILKCNKIKNSENCFAKRFAAKEAFSKAAGTGLGEFLSFKDICILNKKSGKPYIQLSKETDKRIKKKLKTKKLNIYLSISDDFPWAMAFVILSN